MSLLKCNSCSKEISVYSMSCPHCGSKKPFKGYILTRKEALALGLKGHEDFRNFLDRGAKVKINFINKIGVIAFVIFSFVLISKYF